MARARPFGSIRKLPSGRFQARYWHLGKQIAADTTFTNKTDARRWLATVEADLVRGHWIDPDAGKIPFGEYATRWVADLGGFAGHYKRYEPGATTISRGLEKLAIWTDALRTINKSHPKQRQKR